MKLRLNINREIKIIIAVVMVGFLIAFSERKQDDTTIHDIKVKLVNVHENHFMDEGDVLRLMKLNNDNLRGARIGQVNLREIEGRLKTDRFVKDADLYSDLKGNVVARVELQRPIARIVRNDGPDGYIAEDGTVMPVSDKFTSRLVLISGPFVRQLLQQENLNQTREGMQLMEMLSVIKHDEFWHAQIAQLDIDSKVRVSIYPQVGGQIIEFGQPTEIQNKFRKLKIFYKQILPQKGWNKYKRVNLEYAGQIVAE